MGRHRAAESAPSRDWIAGELGKRHRLSRFHNPAPASDNAALLWMFPEAPGPDDYAHRDEAYRNLGTSAASHVLREVFADYDSYVLTVAEQRIVEQRPMRSGDVLHSDVFIDTHESDGGTDTFGVRIVFTDAAGAMVFTNFASFVGHLETASEPDEPPRDVTGLAASS